MAGDGSGYDDDALPRTRANYAPLTPLGFLKRAADVHGDRPAVVYGDSVWTWRETYRRCCQLASALRRRGISRNDTVSVLAPNVPALYEAHYGVPMAGAVLNAINTRLDARTVAHILSHAASRLVICDRALASLLQDALLLLPSLHSASASAGGGGGGSRGPVLPQVVFISSERDGVDQSDPGGRAADVAAMGAAAGEYEQLLAEGDPEYDWDGMTAATAAAAGAAADSCAGVPVDEWDAIALNYTSGTTSDPKEVVCSHRGAYLSALSNVMAWGMHASTPSRPLVYLWTLPMFHCNGWTFPWATAAVAATNVCCRQVTAASIFSLILRHNVTHLCAAPVVLNFIVNAPDALRLPFLRARAAAAAAAAAPTAPSTPLSSAPDASSLLPIHVMTAGAAPPPTVLAGMEAMGFEVLHTYGLTETYGPSVVCEWQHDRWQHLSASERAELKARQGVRYLALEGLAVMDPVTMRHVAADGRAVGEVMMRGNMVMKGYAHNPAATHAALHGGWFHSGDLAVMHPDGYIEIKDRSKDIIISGGENISSIEVEATLYRHPAVLEAAVVARPDATWGETVCAFVTPAAGHEQVSAEEIIAFCRDHLPHYMAPRSVVFTQLPKTATGKVQKFALREMAKHLDSTHPRSRL